jgi:homocysteine S-methyltransferase
VPLESLRHAEFLANEVPGTRVPVRFVERMRGAEEAGRAREEGVRIAADLVAALRRHARGIQLWTEADRLDAVSAVLDAVRQAA